MLYLIKGYGYASTSLHHDFQFTSLGNETVQMRSLLLNGENFSKMNSTLKAPKQIAADDILIFYFYLLKEIRLDFSGESSA